MSLDILKKRATLLRKRIKDEKQSLNRLKHKSRNVRLASGLGPRIGYFTDKLNELESAIKLLEGKIKPKEYIILGNGDEYDRFVTGLMKSIK